MISSLVNWGPCSRRSRVLGITRKHQPARRVGGTDRAVNNYLEQLKAAGMVFSGKSTDGELVEMMELPDHPWFVTCQFHPEFTSTPRDGHALFSGFLHAAIVHRDRVSREVVNA